MDGMKHDWMDSAIAIVGMEGRFSGCPTLNDLWHALAAGEEKLVNLSDEQLRQAGVDPQRWTTPDFVRRASVLEDIDLFDAEFFGMGPREAELTDPQQRLLLECAWAALEEAGIAPGAFDGPVGVYASSTLSKYLLNNLLSHRDKEHTRDQFLSLVGNDKDYVATHIAYKLQLQGPAVSVQTACSSSLVATHLACQALLLHECDAALVSAASVRVPQAAGYQHLPGGIWSDDGRTRPFDARAAGTVFGSGVACVVLMRLHDALERGHTVHAVIRGSAVNNDGNRKVGFTAPSVEGQAEVVASALRAAGVQPEQVSYVEAHGTATPLGDPIEVAALDQAFRSLGWRRGTCRIGSIKGNLGHLDVAAGLTGLIKCTLALRHRTLPASIHHTAPNPKIDFEATPFQVQTVTTPWGDDSRQPLIAGVSSFGIGGTNAHVVLQSPPASAVRQPELSHEPQLVIVSARTEEALAQAIDRLGQHLQDDAALDPADVAYTLAYGRTPMRARAFAAWRPAQEGPQALIAALRASIRPPREAHTLRRKLVLLFGEPPPVPPLASMPAVQRAAILRHEEAVQRTWGFGVAQLLELPAHPAAALLYALTAAQLLQRCGVKIDALACHGQGELAAACFNGVLSIESAMALLKDEDASADMPSGKAAMLPCWSATASGWLDPGRPQAWAEGLATPRATVDEMALEATLRQRFGGGRVIALPHFAEATVPALTGPRAQAPGSWLPKPAELEWTDALSVLGNLWVEGALTTWDGLHGHMVRRFVPLPTYPFQRKRHWIEPAARPAALAASRGTPSAAIEPAAAPTSAPTARHTAEVYLPTWSRLTAAPRPETSHARWLFVGQDAAFLDHLASSLSAEEPPQVLAVSPSPAEAQVELAARLSRGAPVTDLLLDLRAFQPPVGATAAQLLVPLGLLQAAVRACAAAGTAPWRLLALTEEGCQVLGTETCDPAAAAVAAAVRVLNQELDPACRVQSLDLQRAQPEQPSVLAHMLEALAIDPDAPLLAALRGLHAWKQEFRSSSCAPAEPGFRRGGTYLITGGRGRLGRALAALLRRRYDANVALLGRSSGLGDDRVDDRTRESHIGQALQQLPSWLQRVEAEHPMVSLSDFGSLERDLELLCAERCWQAVEGSLPSQLPHVASRQALGQMLQVQPGQLPFLDFVLSSFEAEGWLRRDGDALQWSPAQRAAAGSPLDCAGLAARHPSFGGLVELIEHCANHLVPVLQGREDPLQVLYADGSKSFLESKSQRILDYGNLSQLRAALMSFIDQLADGRLGRPLRVLEVGGGNGVLTRPLVEHLKGRHVEYVFTDIGRTFLLDAQRHAAAHGIDFMSFRRLDISHDPVAQGFEPGGYDLVLALDVLHATPHVAESARNVRRLLAPGGALCLLELVKAHRWTHLLFGFLPGWWCAADAPLRSGSPLLSGTAWSSALREAGFAEVALLPAGPQEGPRAEKVLAIARNGFAEADDRILAVQADVSNADQVSEALEAVRERFGALDGVLHAAAAPGEGGPLAQLPADALLRAALPKVDGLRVLTQALGSDQPRFIACFSSLAATTGMPLNGAYCVANALMEAQACQAAGQPRTVSIAWDRWITSATPHLYGVGEEAAAEASPIALQRMQEGSLTLDIGLDLLGEVIASGHRGLVAVSKGPLDDRMRRHESSNVAARLSAAAGAIAATPRPAAGAEDVQEALLAIWSEVLGVAALQPDDDFFALGGDSLAALQMMNLVQARLRTAVTVDELMKSQTVRALTGLLESKRRATA
ncbi:SDR family oxidoreductase [Rubrivivax gelatinosus]|uniref:SDR family oxidoreductase n=1 Tax=Rubrivivax gelatinosus TaxID=28068 RepID=UPI0002F7739D|nr:SDR family oxidoreductase [Rubrivivax gelatinosus]MBG6082450.1 acyl transferase domain-containing protein/acyl carrier protein [Rubrivivax gelatinosus]